MSGTVGVYGEAYEQTRRMILEDDARALAEPRAKPRDRRARRAEWASLRSLINTYSREPRRHGRRRR